MFTPLKYLFAAILLTGNCGFAQQYDIRTYSVEDGLARSGVYDICEDELGRLWFATEGGGLSCFNGHSFKNYTSKDGLCGNYVRAVLPDKEHGIWVATEHDGVSYFDGQGFLSFNSDSGLCNDHVRALAQDHNGVVWAGTFGSGICSVEKNSRNYTRQDGLASDTVRCAVTDSLGRIWFGTDGGISIFDGNSFLNITVDDGLPDREVLSLLLSEEGVWFGTKSGGGLLGDKTLVLLDENTGLSHSRVRSIWKDREGYIWFGTRNGIDRFKASDAVNGELFITHYSNNNGLSNERIRDIYQDRSGSIWFATYFGGVCQYTDEAFMHFTSADGLGKDVVTAVHLAPNGDHWFGTYGGGATRYDGSGFNTYNTLDGLPDNNVRAFLSTSEGLLVIGTESGVCALINGTIVRPTCIGGNCGAEVLSLHQEINGPVWVGTSRGLAEIQIEDGKLTYQPEKNSSRIGRVNDIERLDGGGLMLATENGLISFRMTKDGPEFLTLQDINPLLTVPMASIVLDKLGHYWIGTEEDGLLRFKGKKVKQFDIDAGLHSNEVSLVMLDELSDVWIAGKKGIDLLELDPLQEYVLDIHHYDVEDGFRGIETNNNAGMVDANGDLWFGTIKGVTRFSPDKRSKNEQEPLTYISAIDLFFEPVDWSKHTDRVDQWSGLPKELELPYDQNHLTFHFNGISQARAADVRYQFRLDGYEEQWSPITDQRTFTYSNIPPGEHTFEVMARNGDGVWNVEPVRFSFTIHPPFWRTPWFIALAIFLIASLIYTFLKLRLKRLENEKTQLEKAVRDRTHDLEEEKHRSDSLLLNILPEATAEELKTKGSASATHYDNCTVLFSDFSGFTSTAAQLDATELVNELDHCFRAFDRICGQYGIEKIKTIGDAYMCACGLPAPNEDHALKATLAAFEMISFMERYNEKKAAAGRPQWPIRVGIHSGPLVAGVVGEKKFAYDIWGDTVNLASRMESNGEIGRVNISGATKKEIDQFCETEARGPIMAKNKGMVEMHFVTGLRSEYAIDDKRRFPNDQLKNDLGLEPNTTFNKKTW